MSMEPKVSKYYDYDPTKELSQQIRMTESTLSQLKKVSPFDEDMLGITNIFDCMSIQTARGIFSLMLYATPLMKDDRAWVKHEIGFRAEKIMDSSFDEKILKTYSVNEADKIFKKHFVSEAK